MDDKAALDYYRDPDNQVPASEARRRQGPRLSSTVPVRFPQEMIAAVRRFAAQDGINVSTWIRRLVAKEIERRRPPVTATSASAAEPPPHFLATDWPEVSTSTATAAAPLSYDLLAC